ncbi:MAG TPA: LamG-like jellyroll fold domain-containing protein, partial [Ferruginibacter sp.]|nr:LamG-like jellyroll fold domain-containing protein [Ferruginibacter sp.]
MKKLYNSTLLIKRSLAGILFFFIGLQLSAQTITNYTFAASSGTFTALSGATTAGSTGSIDESAYNNLPIGFDFWYMGTRYTTISASSNGWMALGTSLALDGGGAYFYVNNLATGTAARPILAPLWDDLSVTNLTDVSYLSSGSAGSRIFTVQCLNMKWDYTTTTPRISFQVKLYEGSGKVEFVYRGDNTASPISGPSASIGISTTGTGSGTFRSLNNAGTSPVVSSTIETTTISARPATGQVYAFTPPVPIAPSSLSFTSIATTSMTLNWTDNSSNESGFAIYRSTDGTNYTYISKTAAAATSSAQSGLTASTTYYWRVYAVTEGGLSTALSGSQATSCVSLNISQIPTSNLILNYKFTGNANDEAGANNGTLQNAPALTTDRFSIANRAYTFNGSTQYVSTANSYVNPTNFTASIWFKTATASGGMLMGFGSAQTGLSASHDRKIYMNNAGQVYFGTYTGTTVTINSPLSYNDNNWHLATATMSGTSGMVLYIDGVQVASNANTVAENITGYWRIGYDNLGAWPSVPTSYYFNGSLDDALVYHTALNSTQAATLYNSPDGAGNNGPVCVGSALNLTATTIGGATYAWTGPNSFASTSQNPTLTYTSAYAGLYTVVVTSGGCTATAYTNVKTAATSSTISYDGSPYCKTGTASVTFSGTAGGTYSSTAGLSINATTGAITLSTSTAGAYTVTYTVAGGCIATAGITVTATPAAPTVTSPVNYCQNATAVQLTATGTNLFWGTGYTSGSVGGTAILTNVTFIDGQFGPSTNRTNFTTTASNVTITTLDYYIPAWQNVTGLVLSLYNSGGTAIATSSTNTTLTAGGTSVTIANTFNYTIITAGDYSIRASAGYGNIGGDNPAFPLTEVTGTINVIGSSGGYRSFNDIQFTISGGSSTAPTPPTTAVGTINYTVTQTVSGCVSPDATIAVVVSAPPTTSAAGADQTSAATCGLTTVTLAANAPSIGTGAWSIVSGSGGTVTTPTSATSTFTGTAGTAY